MQQQSQTIVDLERRFWQSMVDKDAAAAKKMIADDCLITGPAGSRHIDPDTYEQMTRDGKWTLDSFKFSEVEVIHPAADVAVIAYKVRQIGTMQDKPMDLECADSSTWVHRGNAWKCALHTETILGRPN